MAWSSEQLQNARIIATVGHQLGASARDIQIAIATAIVESGLRNVHYGDRDSLGLFQQRAAWAPASVRLDPFQSARMFFLGGRGGQRGLFDFHNRNSMGFGQAAQAVQVSAFPGRYSQHQGEAASIYGRVGGGGASRGGATSGSAKFDNLGKIPGVTGWVGSPAHSTGLLGDVPSHQSLTDFARSQAPLDTSPTVLETNGLGEVTGGEAGIGEVGFPGDNQTGTFSPLDSPNGTPLPQVQDPMADLHLPTLTQHNTQSSSFQPSGSGSFPIPSGGGGNNGVVSYAKKFLGVPYVWGGTSPSGFDCSGFVQYVYRKMGRNLPRISADQARSGPRVALRDLKPGDLVAVDNSSRNHGADHIGIYIGGGRVINAPHPGSSVRIDPLSAFAGGWGVRM